MTTLTLANICLDVQIGICMCLHPSDILSLRKVCPHLKFSLLKPLKYTNIIKTCRAFERITRQRVVWVAALHRVCFENTLFLPSFPISDMKDLEIEKAAMGPRRWIELCGAYEKQHLNDPDAILCPRSTRIINEFPTESIDQFGLFFLVPGGRYLVKLTDGDISVLDLGYTSSSDCKLIASVGINRTFSGGSAFFRVQATPDGMGLTIFAHISP